MRELSSAHCENKPLAPAPPWLHPRSISARYGAAISTRSIDDQGTFRAERSPEYTARATISHSLARVLLHADRIPASVRSTIAAKQRGARP